MRSPWFPIYFSAFIWGRFAYLLHVLWRGRMCSIQQRAVSFRKCGGLVIGSRKYNERKSARDFEQSYTSLCRGIQGLHWILTVIRILFLRQSAHMGLLFCFYLFVALFISLFLVEIKASPGNLRVWTTCLKGKPFRLGTRKNLCLQNIIFTVL